MADWAERTDEIGVIVPFPLRFVHQRLDQGLLAPVPEEGRKAAKEGHCELEQMPHGGNILHGVTAQYETDYSTEFGLPSTVDQSGSE